MMPTLVSFLTRFDSSVKLHIFNSYTSETIFHRTIGECLKDEDFIMKYENKVISISTVDIKNDTVNIELEV